MLTKQQIPLVRILVFYIIGLIIADFYRSGDYVYHCFGILIFFLGISLLVKQWAIKYRFVPGVLLMMSMVLIGYISYSVHKEFNQLSFASNGGRPSIEIELMEKPKQGKRLKSISKVKRIVVGDDTLQARGQLLVYIDTTGLNTSFNIGDKLMVSPSIYEVKNNSNPDVFDYKSYLYYRGVNHQSYISSKDIMSYEKSTNSSIFLWSQRWRGKFEKIILENIKDKDQQAIALAMLLGIRNNVDATLYDSFTNSGAVHVLAVSGLHVGFVAMIFYFLLGLIPIKSAYYKHVKSVIVIFLIFLFGMMTGMAPAIMRAAIMYSIFIVANAWRPATNKYNLLAFSAFVMLLYDPFMLFQAGFQFSYLAILGIMTYYEPFSRLVYIKSNIGSYLMNMVYVSLAAQLLVFPITVFYFHKFPTYFFISGLLAIPAAAIIISLGIALLFCYFVFPWMNEWVIEPLLSTTIQVLIDGIGWINRWPMASIDGLFISVPMMIIIYVIIFVFSLFYFTKVKRLLFIGLIGIVLLQMVDYGHTTSYHENNDFIIYDSYGHYCMDIFVKDRVYNIKSEELEGRNYKFLTYNHRLKKAVKVVKELDLKNDFTDANLAFNDNFLEVGTKSFYFSRNDSLPIVEVPIPLDYIIVSGKSGLSIDDYRRSFDFKYLIVDHSISKRRSWYWKKLEGEENVHIVERDGVFRGKLIED